LGHLGDIATTYAQDDALASLSLRLALGLIHWL